MLTASKEEYMQAIRKLAAEEGYELDECRLRSVFGKYQIDQIDRFYDACHRFGVKSIVAATSSNEL